MSNFYTIVKVFDFLVHCEVWLSDINECVLYRPCKNGATCYDSFGSYSCSCAPGWTGKDCDTGTTSMAPAHLPFLICLVLMRFITDYKVSFIQEWIVVVEINECLVIRPCQNGAECVNTPGSYKCICPPGWTGTNCEIGMCKQTGFYADMNEIYLIDSFQ